MLGDGESVTDQLLLAKDLLWQKTGWVELGRKVQPWEARNGLTGSAHVGEAWLRIDVVSTGIREIGDDMSRDELMQFDRLHGLLRRGGRRGGTVGQQCSADQWIAQACNGQKHSGCAVSDGRRESQVESGWTWKLTRQSEMIETGDMWGKPGVRNICRAKAVGNYGDCTANHVECQPGCYLCARQRRRGHSYTGKQWRGIVGMSSPLDQTEYAKDACSDYHCGSENTSTQ